MSNERGRTANDDDDAANEIRRQYLYRKLIASGKARIPHKRAVRMVGPDCAYHLYGKKRNK